MKKIWEMIIRFITLGFNDKNAPFFLDKIENKRDNNRNSYATHSCFQVIDTVSQSCLEKLSNSKTRFKYNRIVLRI